MLLASLGWALGLTAGCGGTPVEPDARPIDRPGPAVAESTYHVIPVVDTRRGSVSIRAPVRARRADDLVNSIGVNVHLAYFGSPYGRDFQTIVKPTLLASGIRHLRDNGTVLPDDAWMRIVYGRMRELADGGLKFSLIMGPARGVDIYDSLTQFERFVQYAAGSAEAVEGLNEHDLSRRPAWVAEVRSFQKALWTTVKNDPRTAGLAVYGPSMGRPKDAAQVGDLSGELDFGNLHPYPGGKPPLANLAEHRDEGTAISRAKPVVVTETGYHTARAWTGDPPPVSERAMGRYVGRLVFEYFDAGIDRTYLYELIDQGTRADSREDSFGLLRADGTPKPAFTILRNVIAVLADPGAPFQPGDLGYTLAGDTAGVRHTLFAKRDGRFYLVLWQAVASFDPSAKRDILPPDQSVTVELDGAARRLRTIDPSASVVPSAERQDAASITVAVPDSPVIIEIRP